MGAFNPDRFSIKEFMEQIKIGMYNIPNFQRDYVWKTDKIVGLLNSIIQQYPIGIITIAESGNNVLSGKNEVIDQILDLSKVKYKSSSRIIIDGQQRVTSLAIIYFLDELKYSNFKDEIISKKVKEAKEKIYFYDGKFMTRKLIKDLLEIKGYPKNEVKEILSTSRLDNRNVHESVISLIENYEMDFSTLKGWTSEKIIDIFGAINSGSKPLTYVDLASSSIYAKDNSFDLLSVSKKFSNELADYGKFPTETYLQLMKVFSDVTYYDNKQKISYDKKSIVKFVNDNEAVTDFVGKKGDFEKLLKDTFNYLDEEYGFTTFNSIPNNAFIFAVFYVLLQDFENIVEEKDLVIRKFIKHIFARTITNDYSSSTQQKIMGDLKRFQAYVHDDKSDFRHANVQMLNENFQNISYLSSKNSLYLVAIATLGQNAPRNLFKEGVVKISPSLFSGKDTDQHHFIPKKSHDVKDLALSKEEINSIRNIMIISADENRKQIGKTNFDEYIKEVKSIKPSSFQMKMDSHFLDVEIIEDILNSADEEDKRQNITELWIKRGEAILDMIKIKFVN